MNQVTVMLFALVAVAFAVPVDEKEPIRILKQSVVEPHPDGSYSYSYETENGIKVEENGIGDGENDAKVVVGSYSYTAPDGTPVAVQYTADENGYQATGDHLPIPPPIPEQIQRALDYIATHPQETEESS